MLTAESAAVASAIPFISLPPALIPSVLSIVIPPTATLSKDTVLAVPIVILRPVLVMAILSPLMKSTVSPPVTSVVEPVLVVTFQVPPALTASSICFLFTADVAVVPAATFLISVLPASMPEPSTLTVCVPTVAVTPVGATVVVLAPSVVDKPPFVSAVVLPAPSVMVEDVPVTVCVLPAPSVYVAEVNPVNTFANLTFNVPAPSDTTPILPVVKSVGVVTPPLMDNTSPCLRTEVVPVSPSNLCSASANACALLAFAFVTASLIAFATFCVVATPSLPAVVPCVDPAAPTLPVASSRTSLPSSTLTVYVFTPPVVASDTVAKPVPATLTASCAALTATAFTAFSDTATSYVSFLAVPVWPVTVAKLLSPVNVLATTFSVELAAVCTLAIAASI